MTKPPFETEELRKKLTEFLKSEMPNQTTDPKLAVGKYKFGVYAFFDYDGEPIYVGQTNEKLSTRIRRHLTNQRSDAVAMRVIDPFEVYEIEVWPLAEYEELKTKSAKAKAKKHLNWLEYDVFKHLVEQSQFKAVLNEKDPPAVLQGTFTRPQSLRCKIVSDDVYKLRKHADTRIARRAETLSLLAKVINERQVQKGLRKTLLTQAKRLASLAEVRLKKFAGTAKEAKESNSKSKPKPKRS